MRNFLTYFLPEKVLALAAGIFVLVNVSVRYPPGPLMYAAAPVGAAVTFYWLLALVTRPRRVRVRAAKEDAARARWLTQLGLEHVDAMTGAEFEDFSALLLEQNGFTILEQLGGAGDQGVDIIACKDDIRYAIQCKCYGHNLDNTAVQEVCAGRTFYHCHVGAVLANRAFTPGAIALAECNNILLWDRQRLIALMAAEAQDE